MFIDIIIDRLQHKLLCLCVCLLDCLFVARIYFGWHESLSDVAILVLFTAGMIFLIVPLICNLIQLHNEIREWVSDVYCKHIVQAWVRSYLRILYMLTIVFCSAFAAVEICNSNIFHLPMFNMGLNKRQKAIFKNQRFLSIVLLENVPQLILQSIYISLTGTSNYITIVAMMFSIISIISSIFNFKSASLLLNCESITIIETKVESQQIANMQPEEFRQTIVHHRSPIRHEFAKIISVDARIPELLMPIQTNMGTNFTFYIRNTDANQGPTIIRTIGNAIESGEVAQVMFCFVYCVRGVTFVIFRIYNVEETKTVFFLQHIVQGYVYGMCN